MTNSKALWLKTLQLMLAPSRLQTSIDIPVDAGGAFLGKWARNAYNSELVSAFREVFLLVVLVLLALVVTLGSAQKEVWLPVAVLSAMVASITLVREAFRKNRSTAVMVGLCSAGFILAIEAVFVIRLVALATRK